MKHGLEMHEDRQKVLWERLGSLVLQSTIDSRCARLLYGGLLGLEALQSIAILEEVVLTPAELGPLFLPWYKAGPLSDGAWWNKCDQVYTVSRWAEDFRNKIGVPHEHRIEAYTKMPNLEATGPSLIAHDSSLGISLIVDGCRRACASYLAEKDRLALRLSSDYAHVLYPSDFLAHIIRGKRFKDLMENTTQQDSLPPAKVDWYSYSHRDRDRRP